MSNKEYRTTEGLSFLISNYFDIHYSLLGVLRFTKNNLNKRNMDNG